MNKIIVLIPHYNNINELQKSLVSINEPFDVDVMIVDDGSIVKPYLEVLKSVYKGGKIFLELLPVNQGIEKALNHGLKKIAKSDYTYIARLDCGDLNKSNKFQKQLDYLDKNPEVGLLGTWADILDEKNNLLYVLKHPTDYKTIKKKMYLNNMFIHPTIVFRKKIIQEVGVYPENYKYAEDFAYIFKIMKTFKIENYPESLLDYFIAENSISTTKRKQQVNSRIRVIWDNFYLGFYPIYGILRNSILFLLSRKTTTFLKKKTAY